MIEVSYAFRFTGAVCADVERADVLQATAALIEPPRSLAIERCVITLTNFGEDSHAACVAE